MIGPCLCGDPACPRCFPSGQTQMKCSSCDWIGQRHECGSDVNFKDEPVALCPQCLEPAIEADDDFEPPTVDNEVI